MMSILTKEQLERVYQLHRMMRGEPHSYPEEVKTTQFASDCVVAFAQNAVIRDGSGHCDFESIIQQAKELNER